MDLARRIGAVRDRIEAARTASGTPDPATLQLAVKTQTPEVCRDAAQALADLGLPVVLGHNRVQEARTTAAAIREVTNAEVHLIGPLQSNKINQALTCVDLIETVSSPELVNRLDTRVAGFLPVYVQVNTSGESSKHGCSPDEAPALIEAVQLASHLCLEGFMTIGLNSPDEAAVRTSYAKLRGIRDDCAAQLGVPESELALSMGMSHDLEWAIAEGATQVRVGTAVFGPRETRPL